MIKKKDSSSFVSLLLNLCLSISIITAPILGYAEGNAVEVTESETLSPEELKAIEDEENRKKAAAKIEELRLSVSGEDVRSNSSLDPFLMLRQKVEDERPAHIQALIEEEAIEDYEARVSHYQTMVREEESIKAQLEAQLANNTEDSPQRQITKDNLQATISRIAIAKLELEDLADFDPRKGEGLNLQSFIDTRISTRHYLGRELEVVIKDKDGVTVSTVSQKDFSESFAATFNYGDTSHILKDRAHTFMLQTPKGVTLNSFRVSLNSVLFFGHYLVFIEQTDEGLPDNLKFVDLQYSRVNLGNAPLPVFTLPLKSDQNAETSLSIENGILKANGIDINPNQLHFLSRIQQVLFNTSVALSDPSTYESATALIQEMFTYHEAAMQDYGQSFQEMMAEKFESLTLLADQRDQLEGSTPHKERAEIEKLVKLGLENRALTQEESDLLLRESKIGAELIRTNQGLSNFNNAGTRMRLLWEYLKRPRVEGAPKLRNSLVALAFAGTPEDRQRIRGLIKENLVDTFNAIKNSKLARFGAYTTGAVILSAYATSEHSNIFYAVSDMASAAHQHFMGYLEHIDYGKNYTVLSQDAFITSTTGIAYVPDAYATDGKFWRFTYAITSGLIKNFFLPMAAIHIAINAVLGFSNVKKAYKPSERRVFSVLRALRVAAIKDQREFDRGRADAEESVSGSRLDDITYQDKELLHDHLENLRLEEKAKAGLITRGFSFGYRNAKQGFGKLLNFSKNLMPKVKFFNSPKSAKDAMQLLVMASSYRRVIKASVRFWNETYIPRISLVFPSRWLMAIAYPNFVGVAFKPEREHNLPSTYNRGLDGWGRTLKLFLSRRLKDRNSFLNKKMVSPSALRKLKKYETVLRKVESDAIKHSIQTALVALVRDIRDPERIAQIFDSRGDVTSTGVNKLYDGKLTGVLTREERTYFRLYMTHTYNDLLKRFFSELGDSEALAELHDLDSEEFGEALRNEIRNGSITVSSVTSKGVEEAFNTAKESLNLDDIAARTASNTASTLSFLTRLKTNFKHKLLKNINPNDFFFGRIVLANQMTADANSIERATRAIYTDLKTSIPIGIASILVLYAGVDTGLLMPFDYDGLDTETHKDYLSRKLFHAGLYPGLIYGFLGAAWVKLQMDAQVDQQKGFDQVALFKDSQRGLWRYYFKNFFKSPMNKWIDKQLYSLKFTLLNFPSYLPVTFAFQYIGMGRIDAGATIASLIVMSVTMLAGIGLKTDHAFELTKSWVSSQIPRRLRAHPAAQDYIQKRMSRERFKFTIGENLLDIAVIENIAGSMFSFKDNDYVGTRGMLRLVFGGDTPTEIISSTLERTGHVLDAVIPQGVRASN